MHNLYVSLGSNLGDREQIIRRALALLDERVGTVDAVSTFIETMPWGFQSQHPFLNAAALVHTMLSPRRCLLETQQIERDLGRTQKSTNGQYHDRPIDIDLLLYDNLHVDEKDLTLPHPHMHERDFVMIPLREILPLE
ncbi:MAG: 2-amino-4-hydroxy-6-hydroxymethyldihydropteridine diphosphokinase [Bacteroidaceae bacterium]|nr:2-amino-4-hydroxy-6-hydroxymethyldihydropteridine diphosphokinase [Bacteroidaceae bacterium]